jgi:predicted transcriptional regulator
MSQTITLTLPDNVLQPVQRIAQATKRAVEELLVTAL